MELFLLRHGETDYNKKQIIQGGGIDSDLNETGIQQSKAFFDYYNREQFNLVMTSTLKRSYQTVKHFIKTGIKYESTPLINEMQWGIYEGKPYEPGMHQEYLKLTESWKNGDWDQKIDEGESANDLRHRLNQFLQSIGQISAPKVLVCSHGRTLKGLLALTINQSIGDMYRYQIKNTGLTKLVWKEGKYQVDFINDLSHLKGVKL